jgi:hypothetical protein
MPRAQVPPLCLDSACSILVFSIYLYSHLSFMYPTRKQQLLLVTHFFSFGTLPSLFIIVSGVLSFDLPSFGNERSLPTRRT